MTRVIQTNLRRMGSARNLLDQAARETGADVLVISERPRGAPGDDRSLTDLASSAQLALTSTAAIATTDAVRGRYYVGTTVRGIVVFSCYLPPSLSAAQYADALDALGVDCGRFPQLDLVVAGDFNAKVALWGSASTDERGRILTEFAAAHDLQVGNSGNTPTYQAGQRTSVIDFTLARLSGAGV